MADKPDSESLLLVAELWRRRVQWLWEMCEVTAYRPLDIEWLDEQIIKDESDGKTPKG
jgi:hypothetical protein